MNENKNQSNELKTNDLTAKKTAPGGGGQIFGGSQPLSDWVSRVYVRAKWDDFPTVKPYPKEIQLLNLPGGEGIEHWQMLVAYFFHETNSIKEAFWRVHSIHYQYFGYHRFKTYKSFHAQLARHLTKMK